MQTLILNCLRHTDFIIVLCSIRFGNNFSCRATTNPTLPEIVSSPELFYEVAGPAGVVFCSAQERGAFRYSLLVQSIAKILRTLPTIVLEESVVSDAAQKAASTPKLKIDTAIGGSVMIVDDDKIFGQRLGKAFMDRGFDVRVCETVDEAVVIVSMVHLDVVITDLRLGPRSGLAVVEAVKKASSDTKTLVLTGYGNVSSAVTAVKLGATDVLSKPADVDEILEVLGLTDRSNSPPACAFKDPDLLQWEYILSVYEATGENVSKSARLLKMHRRTLQRMLARLQPEYRAERMIKR